MLFTCSSCAGLEWSTPSLKAIMGRKMLTQQMEAIEAVRTMLIVTCGCKREESGNRVIKREGVREKREWRESEKVCAPSYAGNDDKGIPLMEVDHWLRNRHCPDT